MNAGNLKTAEQRWRELAARKLLQAAAVFVSEHQVSLSKTGPPPSKPGEYPRFVTGTGRSATTYSPTSVEEVVRTGVVSIGIREPGWYMARLERKMGRLGFMETLRRIRSRIQGIISSGGKT